MSVLPQAFFTLVGCHLVSFTFFPAGHINSALFSLFYWYIILHLVHKCFSRFECRNIVCRNNDSCVLGNIPAGFFSSFFYDKASKSSQIYILSF